MWMRDIESVKFGLIFLFLSFVPSQRTVVKPLDASVLFEIITSVLSLNSL